MLNSAAQESCSTPNSNSRCEPVISGRQPINAVNCISDLVGNTPLIKMTRLFTPTTDSANVFAKVEFFNPMSSIKDRPAKAMIKALMASSEFNQETRIVEATSGNNGVSCAWLCAIYQIPLTVVIPEHMSIERQKMIKHFGAKVITTPKSLGTKGAIDEAARLVSQSPNCVSLDQFSNRANPDCHATTTAQELLRDTCGQIDVFVAGIGTGGTISGIASTLKSHNPQIEVVAVEPKSCPVLTEGKAGVHKIQGLSSGHIPDVLSQQYIDKVITVADQDAIDWAKRLAIKEGLAVGISSGATAYVACQLAQQPKYQGKNIVVILADTAERYYSTELFD